MHSFDDIYLNQYHPGRYGVTNAPPSDRRHGYYQFPMADYVGDELISWIMGYVDGLGDGNHPEMIDNFFEELQEKKPRMWEEWRAWLSETIS